MSEATEKPRGLSLSAPDWLWLPALCLALFVVSRWAFHHWTPNLWFGDDLDNYMAFRHGAFASNLNQALVQSSYEKYRPVFQLVMYGLFSAFGSNLGRYMAFNTDLNVASGLLMALIAYRLSGGSKAIGALAAIMSTGSRQLLYQVTQVTGIVEGVGYFLFLLMMLALVELHTNEDLYPGQAARLGRWAVVAQWLLVFDHERYLAATPWVAVMIGLAPAVRSGRPGARYGLPLAALAVLPVNIAFKAFGLGLPLLVGTGGSHFAFDPTGYIDRALQGGLSIIGFNDGPPFLVGHAVVGAQISLITGLAFVMALTLAALAVLQWRTLRRLATPSSDRTTRSYVLPAALVVLIGLLFIPPILTIRMEQRWEVEPFALIVMIACWCAGVAARQTKALAIALMAVLAASSLLLDHRLSAAFPSIFFVYSEAAANSIKSQIVDPDRRAVIVADGATCDWVLQQGVFFDLYAPGRAHPPCVNTLEQIGPDLVSGQPRPAIFQIRPGNASVQDVTPVAYDRLAQAREVKRLDFIDRFAQGRINDDRPVQTPTGKGVLILPIDLDGEHDKTLTIVGGHDYRYDHLSASEGDQLRFSALMVYHTRLGARATVTVIRADGARTVVFDQTLPVRQGDPAPVSVSLPLGGFGQDFAVVFSARSPVGDGDAQWIAFDAPRIAHAPG